MKDYQLLTVVLIGDADIIWRGLAVVCATFPQIQLTHLESAEELRGSVDLALYDPFKIGNFDDEMTTALVRHPDISTVAAFTWYCNPMIMTRLAAMGVDAVLPKQLSAEEIPLQLIRLSQLAPHDHRAGASTLSDSAACQLQEGNGPKLSAREAEMVALVATGITNNEIAKLSYLSLNTVKTYLRSAYQKIGVERRAQAIMWAHENWGDPQLSEEATGPRAA